MSFLQREIPWWPSAPVNCLIIALLLIGLPIGFSATSVRFLLNAARTPGVILSGGGSAAFGGHGGGPPTFAFTDARGFKHEVQANWRSDRPMYTAGDRVEVLYFPGDPDNARMRDFMSLWFAASLSGFLTLVPLVLSALFFRFRSSARKRRAVPPRLRPAGTSATAVHRPRHRGRRRDRRRRR